MNCSQLDTFITELARRQLSGEDNRQKLLAHVGQCAPCAARLAEQQALTASLDAARIAAVETCPSPDIETALRAAFRERAASSRATTVRVAPTAIVPTRFARVNRWRLNFVLPRAAAAALAITLLAFGIFGWSGDDQQAEEPATESVSRTTGERRIDVANRSFASSVAGGDELPSAVSDSKRGFQMAKVTPRSASATRRRERRSSVVSSAELIRADARRAEVTTDFLPLTYYAGTEPLDRGNVVRVELPRSALTAMGLPVSTERAGERIEADVLMGEDGVARAIRFVR